MDFYKCFFSIIVICIDHCKRLFYNIFACKDCLTGSPRFFPSFRNRKSMWNIRHFLKCITDLHTFRRAKLFHTISDCFSEIFLNIFTDDKYDLIKSSLYRIMNRIIHDDLAVWSNRFKLLDASPES